jgi:hypothetical protein
MRKASRLACLALCTQMTVSAAESTPKFHLNYIDYEDYIYSSGQKTQVGDQVELEMAFKYNYDKNTSAQFRFETRPEDNRENNKTDKFELALYHTYKTLDVNLDLELLTNDGTSGGQTLGFDLDSEYTNLRWHITDGTTFTFYPFNFDGEVGEEFYTWDVTRINYIEGSPSTVSGTKGSNSIAQKTIPGIELSTKIMDLTVYGGLGVATYIHPTNPSFNLINNASATSWERKEDLGYKFGAKFKSSGTTYTKLEYVGHTQSEETGGLLESAASFYTLTRLSSFIFEGELTWTKAGIQPWEVSRSTGWFERTTTFRPIYSDYYDNTEDWVGKSDFGLSTKIGMDVTDTLTPYVLYRYQGEYFVFNEPESAHNLRTADETKSHGGLHRIGGGTYLRYGDFVVNPEFEYRRANNPVFGNATDVRSDRFLSSFKKNDYVLQLYVTYDFDGNNTFRP